MAARKRKAPVNIPLSKKVESYFSSRSSDLIGIMEETLGKYTKVIQGDIRRVAESQDHNPILEYSNSLEEFFKGYMLIHEEVRSKFGGKVITITYKEKVEEQRKGKKILLEFFDRYPIGAFISRDEAEKGTGLTCRQITAYINAQTNPLVKFIRTPEKKGYEKILPGKSLENPLPIDPTGVVMTRKEVDEKRHP